MALGCYGSCRESYERPQMEKSDAYANRNEVFRLKKVCANCPFRKDIPFDGLSEDRVNDLRRRLNNGEPFHCHKTLDYSKLDDEVNDGVEEPTAVVPQTSSVPVLAQRWNSADRQTFSSNSAGSSESRPMDSMLRLSRCTHRSTNGQMRSQSVIEKHKGFVEIVSSNWQTRNVASRSSQIQVS